MEESSDIIVRAFEARDVQAVAELMRCTWASGMDAQIGTLASLAILSSYLVDHEWGLVAEHDGRLMGTVLAGLRRSNHAERWSALTTGAMERARSIDPALPDRLRAEGDIEAEEARVTRSLKASDLPEADATVQLLVLAKEARGRHLGGRLFDGARDWMRSQGARGYFLMTDDECDVGFYDHKGLRRMVTTKVVHDGSPINVYAYGELL